MKSVTLDGQVPYVPHLICLHACDIVVVMIGRLEKDTRLEPFNLDADGRTIDQITRI